MCSTIQVIITWFSDRIPLEMQYSTPKKILQLNNIKKWQNNYEEGDGSGASLL